MRCGGFALAIALLSAAVRAQTVREDMPPPVEAEPLGIPIHGFGADLVATRDTDRFERNIARAGAMLRYESSYDFLAVGASTNRFRQDDWSLRVNSLLAAIRKVDPATAHGIVARVALADYGGRARAYGEGTWDFRAGEASSGELILERDAVESRDALTRGLFVTFAAASLDHTFAERVTAILMPTYRKFSDGNEQPGIRAWLIYVVAPEQGLAVSAKVRAYTSTQDGGGAYFSPQRYERAELGLRWRRRLESWRLFATADIGRERFGEVEKPTAQLGFTAERRFANNAGLGLQFSYLRTSDSASNLGASSANYSWRMARLYFALPF